MHFFQNNLPFGGSNNSGIGKGHGFFGFAVSKAIDEDNEATSNLSSAYAPRSLYRIFVPKHWRDDYQNGTWFRDKVVLISTATLSDEDRHPIPGATIFGAQFHLQALGCLLENSFWIEPPRWVELASLLLMAGVGTILVIALRHPFAIFLAMIALAGGSFIVCVALSESSGFLFAGTPGILGLLAVTITGATTRIITDPR